MEPAIFSTPRDVIPGHLSGGTPLGPSLARCRAGPLDRCWRFVVLCKIWTVVGSKKTSQLVGGLEHDFYFSHILGVIIPID